jgi:hypothetical protein
VVSVGHILATSTAPKRLSKDQRSQGEINTKRARKRWKTKMNERKKKGPNKKRGRKLDEVEEKSPQQQL